MTPTGAIGTFRRPPAATLESVPQRLGGYVLEQLLGEGAVGRVYRAVREADGAVVAVKVLRDAVAADATYRRRFDREARIAATVRDTHLVPVLEAGDSGGMPYLVLAYIDGPSLAARLRDAGPLPWPEAVRLLRAVALGLEALHRQGLVHRDVKPQNVMLTSAGHALLTDFGLARGEADTVLTRAGTLVGTIDYLAPELVRGEQASPASDLYALGCLAYAVLSGQPPFAGRSVLSVARAHAEEPPPSLDGLVPHIPASLAWVLTRALAKSPGDRPATARGFAALLASAQPLPGTSSIASNAGRPPY